MADNTVPTGTFEDYSETNPNATAEPSNYEICQKSGFKVKPEDLVQQWDGLWVDPEFKDSRHPQEFVRARPETPRGSSRPEVADEFLLEFWLTEAGAPFKTESGINFITEESDLLTADDL